MSNLKAIKRENNSTGSNNKLRSQGLIPAILYGGKDANQNISINKKDLKNLVDSDTFLSKVLELDVDGKKEKVIPRDVAFHVVSEEPVHIDFMRIVAGKRIVLEIPVKFINHPESPGLKRGGVLNIVRRKVELKCPGENIPNEIIVDLAGTDIGTSIKISSVKLEENVVPATLTLTELAPRLRVILSDSSPSSLAISLIDFLGIIPVIWFSTLSFMVCDDSASLCASVATEVIVVSSIERYRPFK